MQKQIPYAFRSGGYEEYQNDHGSGLLNAEMRKTSKIIKKILRVTVQNVLSSSGENQREVKPILGKKFMRYASGNFSDCERQKQKRSIVTDHNAVDESDEVHRVMMEVEPLLEASAKRNWRSIMSTHDEFLCHCLLQTWWSPGVVICFYLGLRRAALHGFTRLIAAHNDSGSGSYDGDTMAGSSCEGEQKTGDADKRILTGIGLSKRYRSF